MANVSLGKERLDWGVVEAMIAVWWWSLYRAHLLMKLRLEFFWWSYGVKSAPAVAALGQWDALPDEASISSGTISKTRLEQTVRCHFFVLGGLALLPFHSKDRYQNSRLCLSHFSYSLIRNPQSRSESRLLWHSFSSLKRTPFADMEWRWPLPTPSEVGDGARIAPDTSQAMTLWSSSWWFIPSEIEFVLPVMAAMPRQRLW